LEGRKGQRSTKPLNKEPIKKSSGEIQKGEDILQPGVSADQGISSHLITDREGTMGGNLRSTLVKRKQKKRENSGGNSKGMLESG